MKKLIFLCLLFCSFSVQAFFVETVLGIFFAGAAAASAIKTVFHAHGEYTAKPANELSLGSPEEALLNTQIDMDKAWNESDWSNFLIKKYAYLRLKYPTTLFCATAAVGAALLSTYFFHRIKEEKKRTVKTHFTVCADS
jgi:hypothetical protein